MTVINNPDLAALSALPVPITVEVSVGKDGSTIHMLPVWLHANYAWRTRVWLYQCEPGLPSFHNPIPENLDLP